MLKDKKQIMNDQLATVKNALDVFFIERTDHAFIVLMKTAMELVNINRKGGYQEDKTAKLWVPLGEAEEFSKLRLTFNLSLSIEQIHEVSECFDYALACTIIGKGLSKPVILTPVFGTGVFTLIEYYYDSTKSIRDDLHNVEAEKLARDYIKNGSPIRKSDRAGKNTKGTRKCEGIGFSVLDIEASLDIEEY